MNDWKDTVRFLVIGIVWLLFVCYMAYVPSPKYICVNTILYEIYQDYMVSTNKDCLPIDKD